MGLSLKDLKTFATLVSTGSISYQQAFSYVPTQIDKNLWTWLRPYYLYTVIDPISPSYMVTVKLTAHEHREVQLVGLMLKEAEQTTFTLEPLMENKTKTKITFMTPEELRAFISEMEPNQKSKEEVIKKSYNDILSDLKESILGQDEIVEKVVQKLKRRDFKLSTDKKKPLSFFWAGPTGVGKTEMAKKLAENLGIELCRLDMSEYQEDHNVSRIIGAPPGYKGYEQDGALKKYHQKECVLLVDEIEKADPLVYNIFLQILDYGTMTDGKNEVVDLSKTIVIMTSNVGVHGDSRAGISAQRTDKNDILNAMRKRFSPEFLNRLDSVDVFNPLSTEVVDKIVDMNIRKVLDAIKNERGIDVKVTFDKRNEIAEKGFTATLGARPIHRAIEEILLEPVASAAAENPELSKFSLE